MPCAAPSRVGSRGPIRPGRARGGTEGATWRALRSSLIRAFFERLSSAPSGPGQFAPTYGATATT